MRVRTFTLCLVVTGCISEDRAGTDVPATDIAETSVADGTVAVPDSDQPDTALPDTAEPADGADAADTADTSITADTSVTADTADTAVADTADTAVADTADTADATAPTDTLHTSVEAHDADTVTGPECLPEGCSAVSAGCEVRPGWCFIEGVCYAAGSADSANACRECNPDKPTVFSDAALGKDCDDGLACTSSDICIDGECHGTSNCETSSFVCATSGCNARTGLCDLTVDSGQCLVANACYFRHQSDASACNRCDPDVDQLSLVPGDRDEPTGGFDQAVDLGVVADTEIDTWSEPQRDASLSPANDRDYYRFDYNTAVSFHRPAVKVRPDVDAPGLTLEVCVFVSCPVDPNLGPTDVSILCFEGSNKVTEGGMVGCCQTASASRTAPLEVMPDRAYCSHELPIQSRADAFVTVKRILPPVVPSCVGYTLQRGARLVHLE